MYKAKTLALYSNYCYNIIVKIMEKMLYNYYQPEEIEWMLYKRVYFWKVEVRLEITTIIDKQKLKLKEREDYL